MLNYKIGDLITYRLFNNALRTIRCTEKNQNIKNKRSGFAGTFFDIKTKEFLKGWGYDADIVFVFNNERAA